MVTNKASKYQFKSLFPPFKFGLDSHSELSLFGEFYQAKAESLEEFIDYMNLSGNLIVKHAQGIYFHTIASYENKTSQPMPVEFVERLERVMYWGSHEKLVYEMIFTRLVENFFVYLTDVIYGILWSKGISEEEIEKEKLKYSTYGEIKRFFVNLGFPIFTSQKDSLEAEKMISIRNIIVHKNGFVDSKFLARFPQLKGISGIRVIEEGLADVRIGKRSLNKYGRLLARVVRSIDKRAIKNYKIITPAYFLEEKR